LSPPNQQVQHIIGNANRFAMRYTAYPARVLYWKYVLLAYRSLIVDMDEYLQQSGSTGSQMEVLLKSLAAAKAAPAGAAAAGATSAADGGAAAAAAGQLDPAEQARLDAVAALAGEEAAVQEQQQQQMGAAAAGVLGISNALLELAGSDD
jgi:hypothetical protein